MPASIAHGQGLERPGPEPDPVGCEGHKWAILLALLLFSLPSSDFAEHNFPAHDLQSLGPCKSPNLHVIPCLSLSPVAGLDSMRDI